MNAASLNRILGCTHNNGHENSGEGNICVDCRATDEEIREAQQIATRVDCPACFGAEDDCDSCDGRGYFLKLKTDKTTVAH